MYNFYDLLSLQETQYFLESEIYIDSRIEKMKKKLRIFNKIINEKKIIRN